MIVKLKNIPKIMVASIQVKGDYDQFPQILNQIMMWIEKNNLKMAGPPLGIYYNSPQEVSNQDLLYEVAVPIKGLAPTTEQITIKYLKPLKVLSTIHQGPYHKLSQKYAQMGQYLEKHNYQIIDAPREIYLNNPMEVPLEKLRTEVQFPVK